MFVSGRSGKPRRGGRRHFTSADELQKQGQKRGDGSDSDSEEDDEEEEDEDGVFVREKEEGEEQVDVNRGKGIGQVIEVQNPNNVKEVFVKASEVKNITQPVELTRKERYAGVSRLMAIVSCAPCAQRTDRAAESSARVSATSSNGTNG